MYDFDVVGHRGAPRDEPENTLASFERAIRIGVDWIEFDLRKTRDGVLVVIHDETVDRTTNGKGLVRDMTFDELRELDAGRPLSVRRRDLRGDVPPVDDGQLRRQANPAATALIPGRKAARRTDR